MLSNPPFTTVATFTNVAEAEICKGMLCANGFDAQLRDAETVSMNWAYSQAIGGVKVVVPANQANLAIACLETTNEKSELVTVCSNCGSTHIRIKPRSFLVWLWCTITMHTTPRSHTHVCMRCKQEW